MPGSSDQVLLFQPWMSEAAWTAKNIHSVWRGIRYPQRLKLMTAVVWFRDSPRKWRLIHWDDQQDQHKAGLSSCNMDSDLMSKAVGKLMKHEDFEKHAPTTNLLLPHQRNINISMTVQVAVSKNAVTAFCISLSTCVYSKSILFC